MPTAVLCPAPLIFCLLPPHIITSALVILEFFGASGLDKSHLAAAIAHGTIEQGVMLDSTVLESCGKNLAKPSRCLSSETGALLELIVQRYERGSTIVTSTKYVGRDLRKQMAGIV